MQIINRAMPKHRLFPPGVPRRIFSRFGASGLHFLSPTKRTEKGREGEREGRTGGFPAMEQLATQGGCFSAHRCLKADFLKQM